MNSIREEFAVTSLAMDLTKDLIATGCYSENKIHFWNVSNQTKVKTIRFDKAFNPINSILFFKNNIAFIANSAANAVILHGENFNEIQKLNRKENPLYCKQDIFIFYIQWLIFLLIGNTMKNTMLRKGLTIF